MNKDLEFALGLWESHDPIIPTEVKRLKLTQAIDMGFIEVTVKVPYDHNWTFATFDPLIDALERIKGNSYWLIPTEYITKVVELDIDLGERLNTKSRMIQLGQDTYSYATIKHINHILTDYNEHHTQMRLTLTLQW